VLDVLIAGAGPAGSIAAIVLARAGMRVVIVDRESFPRDKLCGDTVNPGALSLLESLGLSGGPLSRAPALTGMRLTGPLSDTRARYGDGIVGRALRRRELDTWLLEEALRAGARFESALSVRAPIVDGPVRGVVLAPRGDSARQSRMPARLVIAADGARSTLARSLHLMRTPARPRRWAFGAYATGVEDVSDLGEMHVRPDVYVGVAPMSDDLANVCVVTGPRPAGKGPIDVMHRAIAAVSLADRFRRARFVAAPKVLGPLASDVSTPGVEGLLLAGDAAGFVDPMTGDGLSLAMRGAVLAAEETLRAFETNDFAGAPSRLAEARRRVLGPKLRFNRAVRRISSTPSAVIAASCGARLVPGALAYAINYAGDVRSALGSRPSALGSA
jgi:geranylgeranyl reductase family protein